jgi:hypothetical protein
MRENHFNKSVILPKLNTDTLRLDSITNNLDLQMMEYSNIPIMSQANSVEIS